MPATAKQAATLVADGQGGFACLGRGTVTEDSIFSDLLDGGSRVGEAAGIAWYEQATDPSPSEVETHARDSPLAPLPPAVAELAAQHELGGLTATFRPQRFGVIVKSSFYLTLAVLFFLFVVLKPWSSTTYRYAAIRTSIADRGQSGCTCSSTA
ncbi:hypothetical protein HEP87_59195 [Streptomyces sp. S1D4-11]